MEDVNTEKNTEKVGDIVEVPDDHKLLEKQDFPDHGMYINTIHGDSGKDPDEDCRIGTRLLDNKFEGDLDEVHSSVNDHDSSDKPSFDKKII